MARHPDVVGDEHDDRDEQNRGVEDFLAHPRHRLGERARERGHEARAHDARRDAEPDHDAAAAHALGDREHDADDEARFDDFAKDDDQGAEHGGSLACYWTTRKPSVVAS